MLLEIDKEILSFLNERGRRFTDIRKLLGVNKMRIARRLKALAERGLVFKDKKTGLWRKTNPLDIYKKFPETALEDGSSNSYNIFDEAYLQLIKHARSKTYPELVNLLVQHGLYTAQLMLTSSIIVSAKKQHPESIYEYLKKYMQKYLAYYSTYIAVLVNESPQTLKRQLLNHSRGNFKQAVKVLSQFYSILNHITLKGE
jgi:predicted transcriptional regulator